MWAGEGGRGRSREDLMADNNWRWVHKVKKKSTWTIRFIYRQTDRWIDRLFRKTLTTISWISRLLFSSCLVCHISLFLWFFQVVAQTELLELAKSLAEKISKNSPVAIQHAIQAVNASFDKNQNGFAAEINSFGTCFGTADFKEGTTAFLEKRKPDFQGN